MAALDADHSTEPQRADGASRPLLREVAYERLKNAIRYGELKPGEPLSETRLSEALEISRTPVREALQQLALEGLVQIMPNRAVAVASPSIQEVMNVLHVRSILEPEIVRLVAEAVTAPTLETLEESLTRMEQAVEDGDRRAWSEADSVYHEALSAACPNELLGRLALQMRNRIHVLATDAQTSQDRLRACTDEHRAIVDAIATRDGAAAQQAMQEHIDRLRESFFKRLAHT